MLSDDDESVSDFVLSVMGAAHIEVPYVTAVDSIVK